MRCLLVNLQPSNIGITGIRIRAWISDKCLYDFWKSKRLRRHIHDCMILAIILRRTHFWSITNPCKPLRWRHNERGGVSDHQPDDCLLNRLFMRRSKKTSKFLVNSLCVGNSPVAVEISAQRASNVEIKQKTIRSITRFHKVIMLNNMCPVIIIEHNCEINLYVTKKNRDAIHATGQKCRFYIFLLQLASVVWLSTIQLHGKHRVQVSSHCLLKIKSNYQVKI